MCALKGRPSSFLCAIHNHVIVLIAVADRPGNSCQTGRDRHIRPRRDRHLTAPAHQNPPIPVLVPIVTAHSGEKIILAEHPPRKELLRIDDRKGRGFGPLAPLLNGISHQMSTAIFNVSLFQFRLVILST